MGCSEAGPRDLAGSEALTVCDRYTDSVTVRPVPVYYGQVQLLQ